MIDVCVPRVCGEHISVSWPKSVHLMDTQSIVSVENLPFSSNCLPSAKASNIMLQHGKNSLIDTI